MSPQLLVDMLPGLPRVRSAMTLRGGGASAAPFASLNLGAHVGDAPELVAANRVALRAALQLPGEPLWLQQVHGAMVHADDGTRECTAPVADASLTRLPGSVLAILVADCLPVLLAAHDGSVVAVAHAGWRGLAAGVLEATVARMQLAPAPVQLHAWLGPAISQRHFEVGADVLTAFTATDPPAAEFFVPNARGRWQCDLPGLARRRLERLGIAPVEDSGLCTVEHAADCFSYRRDGQTGRMAALIWLQP